jgi:hypothetical protein
MNSFEDRTGPAVAEDRSSRRTIGMTPPAVEVMSTSSASRNSATGIARTKHAR